MIARGDIFIHEHQHTPQLLANLNISPDFYISLLKSIKLVHHPSSKSHTSPLLQHPSPPSPSQHHFPCSSCLSPGSPRVLAQYHALRSLPPSVSLFCILVLPLLIHGGVSYFSEFETERYDENDTKGETGYIHQSRSPLNILPCVNQAYNQRSI